MVFPLQPNQKPGIFAQGGRKGGHREAPSRSLAAALWRGDTVGHHDKAAHIVELPSGPARADPRCKANRFPISSLVAGS